MKQPSINYNSLPHIFDAAGFRLSGEIATTEMACPEPVMRQAEAFLRAPAAEAAP